MRPLGVLLSPTGYVNVGDPTAYPIGVYNQNTREIATLAVMGVLTPDQATRINAGQAKLEDFNVTLPQMSAAIDLMNAAGSLITSATDTATIASEQVAVAAAQQRGDAPAFVQSVTPPPAAVAVVPATSGTLVPMSTTSIAPSGPAAPVVPAGTAVVNAAVASTASWFSDHTFLTGYPNWAVLSAAGALLFLMFGGGKKPR